MNRFSSITRAALEKAGWAPGRKVDATRDIEEARRAGYPVFDAGARMLEELGGLRLEPPHPPGLKQRWHPSPIEIGLGSADLREREEYDELFEKAGEVLQPIGGDERGGLLFVAEDGRVYYEVYTEVSFIGPTPDLAIENLILGFLDLLAVDMDKAEPGARLPAVPEAEVRATLERALPPDSPAG